MAEKNFRKYGTSVPAGELESWIEWCEEQGYKQNAAVGAAMALFRNAPIVLRSAAMTGGVAAVEQWFRQFEERIEAARLSQAVAEELARLAGQETRKKRG